MRDLVSLILLQDKLYDEWCHPSVGKQHPQNDPAGSRNRFRVRQHLVLCKEQMKRQETGGSPAKGRVSIVAVPPLLAKRINGGGEACQEKSGA